MSAPTKRALLLPLVARGLFGLCGVAAAPAPRGPTGAPHENNRSIPKKAGFETAPTPFGGVGTKDVSGSVGGRRTQRGLLERTEGVLHHGGNSRIRAVLFEEYVVQ